MPVIAAAAIIGGATLGSALIGSRAASAASAAQLAAAQQAAAYQRQINAPFINAGTGAVNTLADMYGFGPNNNTGGASQNYSAFMNSPDYNFANQQGLKALDQSAASRGLLLSGAQVRGAQQFGQGLATQQFGNYFQRMMSLAGLGQSAAAGAGSQVGSSLQAGGQAQASGIVGGANAVTGALGSGVNNLLLYSQLNKSPSSYGATISPPQVGSQSAGFDSSGWSPSYPNPAGGSWFGA